MNLADTTVVGGQSRVLYPELLFWQQIFHVLTSA